MTDKKAVDKKWEKAKTTHNEVMTKEIPESLIAGAIDGDSASLQELCGAIGRRVMFLIMRKLHRHMDAEDATQEVLIRVCNSIKGLKDPKLFNSWLYSIIINETRRHYAVNSKYDDVFDVFDYTDALEDDATHRPDEYIIRDEEARAIMQVVDTLPERQQEAVMLHYFQNFGVVETAQIMGTTWQTVTVQLKRARERLRIASEEKYGKDYFMSGGVMLPMSSLFEQALQHGALEFVHSTDESIFNILAYCATNFANAATVNMTAGWNSSAVDTVAAGAAGTTASAGAVAASATGTTATGAAATGAATAGTAAAAGTSATGLTATGAAAAGTVAAGAAVVGSVAATGSISAGAVAACIGVGAAIIAVAALGVSTYFGDDTAMPADMHITPAAIEIAVEEPAESAPDAEVGEIPVPVEAGVADSHGQIVFFGGDAMGAHWNPTSAEAQPYGIDVATVSWSITEAGNMIYTGTGSVVDGVFADMLERGEEGVYTLNFHLENSTGGRLNLYRDFQICKTLAAGN